jgi:anhydro-N-acetylmuramic acid kinase
MQEFIRIAAKKERLIIGVMSGTSLDGVDIALVRFQGSGKEVIIRPLEFRSYPMPSQWKNRIRNAFTADTEEVCRINYDLGSFFAEQVFRFCNEIKLNLPDLDAVGFHGQTLHHVHQHSTLQSGEAEILARALNTLIVHDFRSADIAAGGSGAPLVPYLDQVLFQNEPGNIALQNLGGIGNITFLPKDKTADTLAFDTGPANAILNETVELLTNGKFSFDQDGRFSATGSIDSALLDKLLKLDYFHRPLPKSTGREEFGRGFVDSIRTDNPGMALPELLRTFVALISHSIFNACQAYLEKVDTLYVSGGGAHHPLIMGDLESLFGKDRVKKLEEYKGISADSKEAVAFALLAHERLNHVPTNVPSVTGASCLTTLGKFAIPYS